MDLNISKQSICINEVVFDNNFEQPIELDYLLPDYLKSIFKVLKCKVTPKISSENIINQKLVIDGFAYIKIIYVSDENYKIHSVTQKVSFSKSIDLKDNYENPITTTHIKTEYINCRAISERRLDIRGALSIKATICVSRKQEIISAASGLGLETCQKAVSALDKRMYAKKDFNIKEDLELSYGKPFIDEILDYNSTCNVTETKIIANKVILKGEIGFHILYSPTDNGSPEIMDYTVPISQIIDIEGITEEYRVSIDFDVLSVDILLKQGDEQVECNKFSATFSIRAFCEANKNSYSNLLDDIFSTQFETSLIFTKINLEELMDVINQNLICKNCITLSDNDVSCIYDILCEFTNETVKYDSNNIIIAGNLCTSILGLNNENMPFILEKTIPCELKIDFPVNDNNICFSPFISISSVSYSLVSGCEIEIRASIKVCGNVYKYTSYNIINDISIDTNNKKILDDSSVLRLYFASKGETIWDIAKKFSSSVDAIIKENSLENDVIENSVMLLIPLSI